MNEEVYVAQSKGFKDLLHQGHVYRLKKGLKQAPRVSDKQVTKYLIKKGYTRGKQITLYLSMTPSQR